MLNGWNAKTISDDPATALKDINTSAANAANATNASRFSSTNNITNSSHHSHSAELSTEDYFIINDSIRMLWKCVSPPSQLGRSGSITPSIFVRLMWRLDAVAAASGDVVSPHVYSEMKDAAQSQNQREQVYISFFQTRYLLVFVFSPLVSDNFDAPNLHCRYRLPRYNRVAVMTVTTTAGNHRMFYCLKNTI
jgi:hypothetical protein